MVTSHVVLTASLEVLNGASRGRRLELTRGATILGRHQDCDFMIADPIVSRRHARIERREDGYYIEDLDSLNGTTVNGRPADVPTRLSNGDVIHLHMVAVAFHVEGHAEGPAWRGAVLGGQGARDSSEDEGLPESALALDARLDAPDQEATDALRVMAVMLRHLGTSLDWDQVLRRTLDGLFEICPQAERGLIMWADQDGQLEVEAIKLRPGDAGSLLTFGPLGRHVATRVMANQVALLWSDTLAGDEESLQESAIEPPKRWMMCAPLGRSTSRPSGLVHLDTLDVSRPFTDVDLRLLRIAAAVAGQSIEYAREYVRTAREGRARPGGPLAAE